MLNSKAYSKKIIVKGKDNFFNLPNDGSVGIFKGNECYKLVLENGINQAEFEVIFVRVYILSVFEFLKIQGLSEVFVGLSYVLSKLHATIFLNDVWGLKKVTLKYLRALVEN